MKKSLTTLWILTFSLQLTAQFSEKNAIYLSLDVVAGNYSGANLNLNYIYHEKISFQAGWSGYSRKAKSPSGYSPGVFGTFAAPRDEMLGYQLLIGRVFVLNRYGTSRLNLSGGIGITTVNEPTNWGPRASWGLFPNYNNNNEDKSAFSLIINPKFEFPFSQFFGFALSPMLQFNQHGVIVGIGFGMGTGLLRGEKKIVSGVQAN